MKDTSGFIALTSVLVLSAIFLSVTISIASRAIAAINSEIAYTERDQARYLAEACADHALLELLRTLNYEGSEVILIGDASCEILLITQDDTSRTIHTQSTVGSHTYTLEVVIDEVSSQAVVTTYQRTGF